ncbi:esterase/lipase family protein [Zavarzinia compransoris]|uniref:Alpha/beta hydrolase n=1 Tax=Zavarzinia compransoris TaxID=1264899 RepID=A0A317E8Q6_9PROT|nr:alpha/beta hydrolase [Zavarzinia compransoris]PWR21683.1 alpha/beta hydrolase [Zavarzinia compransoris]TDP45533.1 hypothetical protein DES42_105240 [Zavarzinia compransoris]
MTDRISSTFNFLRRSLLFAAEARATIELAGLAASWGLLATTARGDGHPVLVIPEFLTGDAVTWPLRRFLTDRGYAVYGWDQGFNFGPRPDILAALQARIGHLSDLHGTRVSLIGVSIGGIYAREAARSRPNAVRSVITLGTPTRPMEDGVLTDTAPASLIDALRLAVGSLREKIAKAPPVPTTALYSRTDGLVAWQSCLEAEGPMHESIEIFSSHIGMAHNPLALRVIADRLSQYEGLWKPYAQRRLA